MTKSLELSCVNYSRNLFNAGTGTGAHGDFEPRNINVNLMSLLLSAL